MSGQFLMRTISKFLIIMSKESPVYNKRPLKRRSSNRSIKQHKYSGTDRTSEKAFNKTGLKQDIHILLSGKRYSSEKMRKLYKRNRRKVVVRETINDLLFAPHQKQNRAAKKPQVRKHRNRVTYKNDRYTSAYNEFDKRYRNNNSIIINSFKRVEVLIDNCHSFVEHVKKVLPTISKVAAFIRLVDDGRKIIISIININKSIDELIDVATTEDNDIVATKDEFKVLVDIIKETKEIYDSLKDATKEIGIIIS